jgi:hypothetical protein
MHADITLLLLLYYVAISQATELLAVDYCALLQRWWSKRLRVNLRSYQKRHLQRRSRLLPNTPSPGHRPEKSHPRFRQTRSGAGRGIYSILYYYYILLLFCRTTAVPSVTSRPFCACTSTCTPKISECFSTDESGTETYDSDSSWIGVDSLSMYCITNSMSDFVGKPKMIRRQVKGINDTPAQVTYVGKGKFRILDSKGRQHEFIIHELYYCATSPMKILSPQHIDNMWRQQNAGHRLMSSVDSDGCVLQWVKNNKYFTKIIPINKKTGVPMFKSSPGYQRMANYMSSHPEIMEDEQMMCCQACHVIEDDESVSMTHEADSHQKNDNPPMVFEGELTPKISNVNRKHQVIEFGDEDIKETPIADSPNMDPTSEMLFLHYKLGHISFNKIKQMA